MTIQFGHNDQKVTSGVNVTEYGSNLERFGREVQEVGGIAVSVLCLLSFCLLPSLFEILLAFFLRMLILKCMIRFLSLP